MSTAASCICQLRQLSFQGYSTSLSIATRQTQHDDEKDWARFTGPTAFDVQLLACALQPAPSTSPVAKGRLHSHWALLILDTQGVAPSCFRKPLLCTRKAFAGQLLLLVARVLQDQVIRYALGDMHCTEKRQAAFVGCVCQAALALIAQVQLFPLSFPMCVYRSDI